MKNPPLELIRILLIIIVLMYDINSNINQYYALNGVLISKLFNFIIKTTSPLEPRKINDTTVSPKSYIQNSFQLL